MKTEHGDLITLAQEGYFDVIVHGCNCFCQMGAGIAKAIREAFPGAYEADLRTKKGDRSKLGTVGRYFTQYGRHSLAIVNAYTQYDYRGSGVKVDYDALRSCFRAVARYFPDDRIGYPMIGAGLAGGDWPTIAAIIDEELDGLDHTLVLLPDAT